LELAFGSAEVYFNFKNPLMKYFVWIASFTLFLACKKEESTAEPTTEEMIVGSWKGDKNVYTEDVPGQPPYQETEDISAYNFMFKADGTFTIDSAGLDSELYEWSVAGNNEFIWRYDANTADVLEITELTANRFRLKESGTYINSNNLLVSYTDEVWLVK
jgi:hypothetical protein